MPREGSKAVNLPLGQGTEVYVVVAESGEHSDLWRHVAGVYETREAAEAAISAFKKEYETCEIEKRTIGEWQ